MDISERQRQLLLTIISEFIETAEAVGSLNLQSKYGFKVSPATIRNEMAELVSTGYLLNRNSSGGRVPTLKGWRYFIGDLLEKGIDDIDVVTQESIKSELVKIKYDKYQLLRKTIGFLSTLANNPAIALVDGEIFYAGLAHMIDIPEFKNSANLQKMLEVLEDYYALSEIMNDGKAEDELSILFGEETDFGGYKDFTVVFTEIRLHDKRRGYIAVIGPNRMRYNQVLAAVKYLSKTVKYLVQNW